MWVTICIRMGGKRKFGRHGQQGIGPYRLKMKGGGLTGNDKRPLDLGRVAFTGRSLTDEERVAHRLLSDGKTKRDGDWTRVTTVNVGKPRAKFNREGGNVEERR